MIRVYDVEPNQFIRTAAEELESSVDEVATPDWAAFVKTGVHKERRPQQDNWWYIRSAALLRRLYTDGPTGVRRLRTLYGGVKNRGHKPEHHRKASGKVLRVALQQLEEAGLVKTEEGEGRKITGNGQKFLDAVAKQCTA